MEKKEENPVSDDKQDKGSSMMNSLRKMFESLSFSDDKGSGGKTITQETMDGWLKRAGLMGEGKQISSDDTAAAFKKISKDKKGVDIDGFKKVLEEIAANKKLEMNDLVEKIKTSMPDMSKIGTAFGAMGAGKSEPDDQKTGAGRQESDSKQKPDDQEAKAGMTMLGSNANAGRQESEDSKTDPSRQRPEDQKTGAGKKILDGFKSVAGRQEPDDQKTGTGRQEPQNPKTDAGRQGPEDPEDTAAMPMLDPSKVTGMPKDPKTK